MGYVKSGIRKLVDTHGSRRAARNFADDWYENGRNDRKITEVNSIRERFRPGKIYSFEYRDPITPNLPWFDEHPVVLALDSKNKNDMGVNLNLLPIRFKEELLDDVYEAVSGHPQRITYEGVKNYLDRYGFGFAIRQYIPGRKRNQAVVVHKAWPKIALANLIEINGATTRMVRLLHTEYMRN
jgi:hypothetical protein